MGGWSYCPHEQNFTCKRLKQNCDPGVPGCILYGRIEREDLEHKPPVPPRRKPAPRQSGTDDQRT
ncbi:MAG: hypothetical protein MAG451_02994 [Anaerolineales bacterium]|nr:hypothetical protein [Anaerolineales bacterium]